ncbi:MAG: crosslink repair DNA glycosylase YcaQ family protein [Ilumatobacteraceae bacterium]
MTTSPADVSVMWAQALAWRLGRHLLEAPSAGSVADVVRRLGAVLATDGSLCELAVRTRLRTSSAGDLAQAVADGEVIEVFAFRGARHYLAADEGGMYLALRSAGRQWELASWVEHYGLTPSDWPEFRSTVRGVLIEGTLTVAELGQALTLHASYRHLRPVFDTGAGTLIKSLTWQGDVSFGPRRDGQQTLQRLDSNPSGEAFLISRKPAEAPSRHTSARMVRQRSTTSTTGSARA